MLEIVGSVGESRAEKTGLSRRPAHPTTSGSTTTAASVNAMLATSMPASAGSRKADQADVENGAACGFTLFVIRGVWMKREAQVPRGVADNGPVPPFDHHPKCFIGRHYTCIDHVLHRLVHQNLPLMVPVRSSQLAGRRAASPNSGEG